MNKWQLYLMIRRNLKLGFRRSPVFEQGMVSKVMTMLGAFFFILYLFLYGCIMGMAVEDGKYETIIGFMPIVLVLDFLFRFMVQQTPDMQVKPYLLLPVSKYSVIDHFLVSSVFSIYNLLWLAMFVPYTIIILIAGCDVAGSLATLICCELLIMLNSQIYLMIRTLIGRSLWWWFLAVFIYALPFLPAIIIWSKKGIDRNFDMMMAAGGSCWFLPVVIVALLGMLVLNRKMQFAFVYEEISKEKKDSPTRIIDFSFFSRFGQTGEYLKLEIKSVMRNKAIRSRFWMSLILIAVFSALIAYTPIYNGTFNANFWCFYCFSLYALTTLTKIMCPEGNYIDLLMTHKENILDLLKAKYYFQCAILLVPFCVMLPALIEGKFSLLMMVAYMFLCCGPVFFLMFQLAVYNKQTIPLNQKMTGKGNFENGLQLIIELCAIFVPIIVVVILQITLDSTTAYVIQALLGLAFFVSHPWWLRNIYQRMMVRKYENMEGFRATR
jgi:hypothetical protein